MRMAGGDERLASLRLMHALDEVEFFEFFERAVDRDETKRAVSFARPVEDLDRGESAYGGLYDLDDSAASAGDAVSVFLQFFQPGVNVHGASFLKLKIIFNSIVKKKQGVKDSTTLLYDFNYARQVCDKRPRRQLTER